MAPPSPDAAAHADDLDGQIAQWRAFMDRRRELRSTDADELEDHLRGSISDLTGSGLQPDEAFLIAVKRMGSLDELSAEFAREHSDRLWKQLVLPAGPDASGAARARRDVWVMLCCAAVAAVAVKLPTLFGVPMAEGDAGFYAVNASLFVLPVLAAYFVIQRRVAVRTAVVLAALFVLGAVAANAFPLADGSQALVLTAIHLPIALWLVVGVAYAGGDWRSDGRRMDFIRFTGEWFIYFVLLGLGGGVLMGFAVATFDVIGLDAGPFIETWVLPCGAAGAILVAAWLVEAKQDVIENMAPVLTRVLTPLFAVALLAFLVGIIWTNNGLAIQRDALILFDLLLVVVLGLLLYSISARDLTAEPGAFDRLQLALVGTALIIDAIMLLALAGRISDWGFTPNRAAALGENVILLTNLVWSAWLLLGFVRGKLPFTRLERWQTGYVIVYFLWAWTVVLAFPLVFDFA